MQSQKGDCKMKKNLFAIWPAMGHITPTLEFATYLKSQNIDVEFYSSKQYKTKVNSKGIKFHPFEKQQEFTGETLEEKFPEYFQIKSGRKQFRWGIDNIIVPTLVGFSDDVKIFYYKVILTQLL